VFRRPLQLNVDKTKQLLRRLFRSGHASFKSSVDSARVYGHGHGAKAMAFVELFCGANVEEENGSKGVSKGEVVDVRHAKFLHSAMCLFL
jgi:hypothetical protein